MVEIVDIFPTMIELAGLSPFDPKIKNEPPLEGQSLVPLLKERDISSNMFNLSFSQYARQRCPNNLYANKCDVGVSPGHYIGFTVRSFEYRYTRWVNTSLDG